MIRFQKKAACFRDPQNIFCRVLAEKTLPDCQHTVKTECSRSTTGFKCEKRCEKMLCGDEHPCKKKCFQHCGPCLTEVTRTLECGHSLAMPCHTIPSPKMCRVPKESLLPPCGHLATIHCGGDPNKAHCSLPCNVRLDCGHTCTRKCHVNKDADHCDYQCKKPCERMKKGCKKEHRCGKKCFEECDPCTEKWERVLPCGHQKFTKCHLDDEDIFCSYVSCLDHLIIRNSFIIHPFYRIHFIPIIEHWLPKSSKTAGMKSNWRVHFNQVEPNATKFAREY